MSDLADPERGSPGREPDERVPGMPAVRVHSEYGDMPVPLADGFSPTIGWQWLPEKKGGPAFAVITRSRLGSLKTAQRFPMTEEGWAGAWRALASLSPHNAARAAAAIQARRAEGRIGHDRDSAAIAELDARSVASLHGVALLGGYAPGNGMIVGERYDARFLGDRLVVCPHRLPDVVAELPYRDIEEVEIGGPGVVKSGGGFAGGGFGAVGALEGMAVAAVLNALTTRTTITTVVRVQAAASELFLLDTRLPPEQLRIYLSRPLGAIRAARAAAPGGSRPGSPASPVGELTKLASMLESGLLTREEFDTLKTRLLNR
jgi:hypothetical protein